jgi:hypothetical protein
MDRMVDRLRWTNLGMPREDWVKQLECQAFVKRGARATSGCCRRPAAEPERSPLYCQLHYRKFLKLADGQ